MIKTMIELYVKLMTRLNNIVTFFSPPPLSTAKFVQVATLKRDQDHVRSIRSRIHMRVLFLIRVLVSWRLVETLTPYK